VKRASVTVAQSSAAVPTSRVMAAVATTGVRVRRQTRPKARRAQYYEQAHRGRKRDRTEALADIERLARAAREVGRQLGEAAAAQAR